jgi:hypothetical protein
VESLRSYLILLAVLAFAFWAFRRRPELEVRIANGRARVTRGRVPPSFVDELVAIFEDAGIESGWICSTPDGNRTRLSFSKSIPEGVRQRVRNVWFARRRVEKPAW